MGNTDSNASVKTLYANYVAVKQLNDERYGEGRIVRSKQTKEEFFQKEINLTDEIKFKKFKLYLERMASNQHPNLVNLINTYQSEDHQFCGQFFKLYLILEYLPSTLYSFTELRQARRQPYSETELWTILCGAVEGLARLESMQIPHQSVRIETLSVRESDLLVKTNDPNLGNGISSFQALIQEGEYLPNHYISPKLMQSLRDEANLSHNPYKSDVYSLGMLMLHLSQLQTCDDCYDFSKNKILQQQVQKRINQLEGKFSQNYLQILRTMLLLNEEQRPDFTQLKQELATLSFVEPLNTSQNVVEVHTKANYVESEAYESFKAPPPLEVNAQPITDTSAKFNLSLKESAAQGQTISPTKKTFPPQSPQVLSQGQLRENFFKPDQCDFLRHIPISQKPAEMSEPDKNVGNQIGADFDGENGEPVIEDLQPPHSLENSAERVHQSAQKRYEMEPASYDSYNVNKVTFDYKISSAREPQPHEIQALKNSSNHQKYDYLFDKQLSNQQKVSMHQQEFKRNFEAASLTSSARKERVTEHYANGSRYEGEKLNGLRHGQGTFFYQDDGGVYEGQWFENKMHGQGTLYYASGKPAYEGQWVNDKFEGKGTLYNEEPQVLYGEFDFRDFDKTKDFWTKYTGQFHEDNKEGYGVLYLSNGERFEGYFLQDLVSGPGKFYKKSGKVIDGRWWQNKLQQ